ncbi:MAG: ABC transporter ATP-binding protein [Alphaproteobacteria bacterium]|nr:ABC transporter ATP-binding protein [Alphaproteobacteria bacterium]MBT7943367.1 ABC transporter ATP-binding protein [Alphaproteobacteria bacterium]
MIPAGEVVCLLGPSGSGKTTLLRLAAGLEQLQQGTIAIDDEIVADTHTHVAPEDRGIGLMFQDYALFPHLNVIDNVTFGLLGQPRDQARRRAMDMLDQVGMAEYAQSHPHTLSGGQQQRVALARALAPEPRVLLLDEPFSGLDTNMRGQIREETLSVLKANDVATVMVTHDPEEAMFMADRIKILGHNGKILQAGRPHEIYYHPRHEFVAKLFGMMNVFNGVVKGGQVEIPLGRIAADDLEDGSKVEVLVRPEGVILEIDGKTGSPVEVISTHLLGHDNIVRVRLDGTDGIGGQEPGQELTVRIHHTFEPELSQRITAGLDPEYAFVFPLDEGNFAISQSEAAQ